MNSTLRASATDASAAPPPLLVIGADVSESREQAVYMCARLSVLTVRDRDGDTASAR